MTQVTLSKPQISVAGRDGANYQGVGCPHPAANIQEGKSIEGRIKAVAMNQNQCTGDFVLDVGSGLGVDSFIAAAATGEEVPWSKWYQSWISMVLLAGGNGGGFGHLSWGSASCYC